jgi:hypothetical protein
VNGNQVATATMSVGQGNLETLQLQGAGITHVSIRAPRDETILVQICCIRFVKGKDKPEIKEGPKELKDSREKLPELFGAGGGQTGGGQAGGGQAGAGYQGAPGPSIEERLARLEASLGQNAHFIGAELRPDLTSGALNYETDLSGAASQWHDVDDA